MDADTAYMDLQNKFSINKHGRTTSKQDKFQNIFKIPVEHQEAFVFKLGEEKYLDKIIQTR
ncbi:MAG: hypothetical protein M9887_08720 [Chitinophagales bacterium]|nr:hypothetical protein [Chitinophagales bacterium]